MANEIRFRLGIEGAQQVQQGAEAAAQGLNKMAQAGAAAGAQGKLTGQQTAQLSAQLQDLFVQIQAGGSPMTALLQQGSQLSAVFGGVGNALKAVGTLVTPVVAALGVAAAAAGGIAAAFVVGAQESKALADALALTGNAAGITEGRFNAMADAIGKRTQSGVGAARDALQELVASGKLTSQAIEATAGAAAALSRATGEGAAEIARRFVSMADDAAGAAKKLNEQYNFLTAAQYASIKATQEAGDTNAAVAETMRALEARVGTTVRNLGTLERAWQEVKLAVGGAWDAMKGIGRDQTLDDQIAKLRAEIDGMDAWIRKGAGTGNTAFADATRQLEMLTKAKFLDGERAAAAAQYAAQQRAGIQWIDEGNKFLDKRAQMEREIAQARTLAAAAGKPADDPELLKRIEAIRDKHKEAAKAVRETGDAYADVRDAAKAWAKTIEDARAIQARAQASALGLSAAQSKILEFLQSPAYAKASDEARQLALNELYAARSAEELADAQKESAAAADRSAKAWAATAERIRQVGDQYLATLNSDAAAVEAQVMRMEDEAKALDLSAQKHIALSEAIIRVQIARLREKQVDAGDNAAAVAAIERQIDAMERLIGLTRGKDARTASAAAASQHAAEWERINDQVGQSLSDALMEGGRSAAEYIKGLFRSMVLRPIIQGAMSPVSGAVASFMSGGAGRSGGGWAGNAMSAYGAIDTLASGSAIGSALFGNSAAYGAAIGTTSVGAGSQAAMLAAQTGEFGWAGLSATYGAASGAGAGGAAAGAAAGAGSGGMSALAVTGWVAVVVAVLYAIFGDHSKWSMGSVAERKFEPDGSLARTRFDLPYQFGNNTEHQRDDKATAAIADQIGGSVASALQTFGGSASGLGFSVRTDADREGEAAAIISILRGGQVLGGTQTGSGAFGSVLPEVAATKINADQLDEWFGTAMPQIIVQALQQSDLEDRFEDYFDSVAAGADLTSEKASELLQTASAVKQLGDAFSPLGGVFAQFESATVPAVASVAKAAGGFDALGQAAAAYYQNYYTEAEKTKISADAIAKALSGVGLAMPDLTGSADEAVRQFRAMVDAQDLSTEAGADAFATLMQVQGAFHGLTEAAKAAAAAVAQERGGLEERLLQLQGNTAELRRRERDALDESNRALYDQIKALEDQRAAIESAEQAAAQVAQERAGLEGQLMQLQGRTLDLRNREREALDATNRALFDQVQTLQAMATMVDQLRTAADGAMQAVERAIDAQRAALQRAYREQVAQVDAQAAAAEAAYKAVADQVSDQRTAAKATYDAQVAPVQAALALLEQQEKDRSAAYRDAVQSVTAERDAARTAYAAAAQGLQDTIRAATDTVGRLRGLNDSLRGTLSALRPIGSEGADRLRAQAQITQALAVAKAGGALPSAESLRDSLSAITRPSEDLFGSFEAYQRDFYRTAIDIRDLQSIAGDQLGSAQAQLDATVAMKDALDAANGANIERLDGIRAALDLANEQARDAYDVQREALQGQMAAAREGYDARLSSLDAVLSSAQEARALTLEALSKEKDALTVKLEADLSALDGILAEERRQYEAIVGVDTSVKSVEAAIAGLRTVLTALATATGTAPPAGGTAPATGQWVTAGGVSTWLDQAGAVAVTAEGAQGLDSVLVRGADGRVATASEVVAYIGTNIAAGTIGPLAQQLQRAGISAASVDAAMGYTGGTFAALLGNGGGKLLGTPLQQIREYVDAKVGAGDIAGLRAGAVSAGITAATIDAIMQWAPGDMNRKAAAASVPAFAGGGLHTGGVRLVGEDGPELAVTGPERIYSFDQLMQMAGGRGRDEALLDELRALRREVSDLKAAQVQTVLNTGKAARTLDDVVNGGASIATRAEE